MFSKAWNALPSTNDVVSGVKNTVQDAGNTVYNGAKDGVNYVNNTANAAYGNLTGDFSKIHTASGDHDNGNPDYECCLELRIANTFGYDVTDIVQIGMEEWALDFAEAHDGYCSEVEFKDGYEGASGFNRLFWVKVNAPGNFKSLVKSFDSFTDKIVKKATNSFNVKGFSMSRLGYNTRSCGGFDADWNEIPKNLKKLIMGIASGKVDAKTAGQRLEAEMGKKIQKQIRKKIDKKLKKILVKQIIKISTKIGAKAAGKSLAKKIPGVGALVGFGYGISEICQGNYAQAGLEMGSGLASTVPGPGTALSLALDAAGASKEIIEECLVWYQLQEKVDALTKQYD